jgi:hypothetical protein
MNITKTISLVFIALVLFTTCKKSEIDDQKPEIDMSIAGAFPANCDTLYLGETFTFKAMFTDNAQLGSYSIDIHNNFDHHSHSTEVSECNLSPIKQPVNPFLFIHEYDIPEGNIKHEANISITIPEGYDEGDYHFFISLTDHSGWSAQKGISIKIIRR